MSSLRTGVLHGAGFFLRSKTKRMLSLQHMLFGSFTLLLSLLLSLGLFAIASEREAVALLSRILQVDMRSVDLSVNTTVAVMHARRNEKNFLLNHTEFGFDEAKSRYLTLFRANLRDARTFLAESQTLAPDAETATTIDAISAAISSYESQFVNVVDFYQQLGHIDTGLEGAFRAKAHSIEEILGKTQPALLQFDFATIRRYEKDFIRRGREIDSRRVAEAIDRFTSHVAAGSIDATQRNLLIPLIRQYHASFEQYVHTNNLIEDKQRDYLASLQNIEPALERLAIRARAKGDAALERIVAAQERGEKLITATTVLAILLGISTARFVYRRVMQSLGKSMQFARRVAGNDLTARIDPVSHDEFGVLDLALNQMADALLEGRQAQERKSVELAERNAALGKEMTARLLAEAQLLETNRNLEQGVAERTAQLRLLNEKLVGDIEARKRTEHALILSEERFRRLTDMSSDWYWEQDHAFRYTIMSHHDSEKREKPSSHYIGRMPWELPINLTLAQWAAHKAVLAAHEPFKDLEYQVALDTESRWFSISGEPLFDTGGTFTGYRGIGKDITERKETEAKIQHMALHDGLTGLANRPFLRDRLIQAIAHANRQGHAIWVVFIDLDRFKFINDSLGHKAGDLLLQTISERLKLALRADDTVARLGGDEFVLVLPDISEEGLTISIVQRVLEAVAVPMILEGQQVVISCSIGIAAYPGDGTTEEELIEHADMAMYRAKQSGRNNFQFYTPAMNESISERLAIEVGLRRALDNDELVLHYQPQIDLETNRIVGTEALIRWRHPEHGLLTPSYFIRIAEETGLIGPINLWGLKTACAQNKAWQTAGHANLCVAVNMSSPQFMAAGLAQTISDILDETGLAPHCLDIELTESLLVTDVERAVGVLQQLSDLGVRLSIDDFGTGYSSLQYLKRLPVNVLKIDRSFVQDISVDEKNAAIVASIISLAHNLDIRVTAEGVETQEQLDFLREHRCDQVQGFYFGREVSAEKFERMLREGLVLSTNTRPQRHGAPALFR